MEEGERASSVFMDNKSGAFCKSAASQSEDDDDEEEASEIGEVQREE